MCVLRERKATTGSGQLPLGRCVSLVPSLSDLSFLMPLLVLFWCTAGVAWLLTDSDTGWHIRTGECALRCDECWMSCRSMCQMCATVGRVSLSDLPDVGRTFLETRLLAIAIVLLATRVSRMRGYRYVHCA
jgi:hypothetical protein